MIAAGLPARWMARVAGDARRGRHWNVLLTSCVLLLALALRVPEGAPGFCLLRRGLGVDCPFCGVTRAAMLAAGGAWGAAWQMHAGGAVVVAVLALQLPWRLCVIGGLWRPSDRAHEQVERAINIAVVVACLAATAVRIVGGRVL